LGKEVRDRGGYAPPDEAIEALARCLYPAMVAYFESDQDKREFAAWKAAQAMAADDDG
jgi:hypothetical protein